MNENEISQAIVDLAKEQREIGKSVAELVATNQWQVEVLKDLKAADDEMRINVSGQRQAFTKEIKAVNDRVIKIEEHVEGTRRWGMFVATVLGGLVALLQWTGVNR